MNIPDNFDIWEAHDIEQERRRMRRPECSECGEHIQDEKAYYINGEWICENCMSNYHVYVDDYCE
jgi:formylmethanofuran dehydrogenase subunit E